MPIRRSQYEIIKSAIHMSIVPYSVKKLWFKDKKFKKWYDNDNKRENTSSK